MKNSTFFWMIFLLFMGITPLSAQKIEVQFNELPDFSKGKCEVGDCNTGYGRLIFDNCRFDGYFKDGKPDGPGMLKGENNTWTIISFFLGGKLHGTTFKLTTTGTPTFFLGEASYNNANDKGYVMKENMVYAGNFLNGTLVRKYDYQDNPNDTHCRKGSCSFGFGQYSFTGGGFYIGFFISKQMILGNLQYSDGSNYYGEMIDNKVNGQGIMDGKNNLYIGYYKDGVFHGRGLLMDKTTGEIQAIDSRDGTIVETYYKGSW